MISSFNSYDRPTNAGPNDDFEIDTVSILTGIDTDGDGFPNCRDLDSDNDGISDLLESGQDQPTVDADNNGVLDDMEGGSLNDLDHDGLSDAVEFATDDTGQTPVDTDGDGIPEFIMTWMQTPTDS